MEAEGNIVVLIHCTYITNTTGQSTPLHCCLAPIVVRCLVASTATLLKASSTFHRALDKGNTVLTRNRAVLVVVPLDVLLMHSGGALQC